MQIKRVFRNLWFKAPLTKQELNTRRQFLCLPFSSLVLASTLPKKFFCWTFSPKHILLLLSLLSAFSWAAWQAACQSHPLPPNPPSTCVADSRQYRLLSSFGQLSYFSCATPRKDHNCFVFFTALRSMKGNYMVITLNKLHWSTLIMLQIATKY